MSTPRKPLGYEDRYLLDRALGANERMAEIIAAIADTVAKDRCLAGPMMRMATLVGQQAKDLSEMRVIRRNRKE